MANGTINLVNNSTALTGVGSKFLTEVTPGDFIYAEVGTVPYTLPVDKVNSDTSITLLRKFTGPTINGIAWTLIPRRAQNSIASALADQVAEAIRLSLNNENNWQKLLTENGNVTITRPDGSTYTGPSWVYLLNNTLKLEDIGLNGPRHLDDLNDVKLGFSRVLRTTLNNSHGVFGGGFITSHDGTPTYVALYINPEDRSVSVGNKAGVNAWGWSTLMNTGDYGFGGKGASFNADTIAEIWANLLDKGTRVFRNNKTVNSQRAYSPSLYFASEDTHALISVAYDTGSVGVLARNTSGASGNSTYNQLYGTANTTKASDGTLKAASPIVKLFADGSFETNDESEGATVTRLGVGQYLIEGCEALNSDAAWGGWDGGFDIPTDRNKQPLIWLDYDVNPDGSVLVKTYHRTHPDSPEFARNRIGYKNDAGEFIETVANGDPVDIPSDQFVSVRVEMPQDSIWNQRQKEIAEMMDAETSNQELTTGDEVEKG
ncbi:phage tail protein [Enterobacter cloacae subsp. dissolvens]